MVSDGASVASYCIVHGYHRTLLLGIGLFSSQWMCFLVVLAMSFSQIQKLGAWAIFLDSLVTIIIYTFAILNAYHLA